MGESGLEGAMHRTEHSDAFSRETLFRQIGPLVGAILLWLVYSDTPRLPDEYSETIIWGAALIALAVVLTVLLPWHRLPRFARLVPPLVYLLAASGLGPAHGDPLSSWAGLFLLPVFWISVYATGLELAAGVLAVALAILTPVGSAGLRPDPAQAFALIALAGALGIGCQRLFEEVRARATGLERLARTDPLTGVPNLRVWEAALSDQLAEAARWEVPASVAMLDVDNFKAYNDRFGHQAGDRLLKFFAARWQSELRNGDLLARIGGDEFAVLLPRCPLEAGGAVIRRLCSVPASTTTSAGVASWDGRESMEGLIARADRALYQAKQEGRSRIVLAETPPPPAPPRSPQSIHLAQTPGS
jgi:diguanylate cyclase (GGDEF)-like protein